MDPTHSHRIYPRECRIARAVRDSGGTNLMFSDSTNRCVQRAAQFVRSTIQIDRSRNRPTCWTTASYRWSQSDLALAKHLTAEKKVEEFVAGKGVVTKWERLRRQNHWFDALYNACAAGNCCGVRLVEETPQEPKLRPKAQELAARTRSGMWSKPTPRW
jgi:hypothetical protein